MRFFIFKSETTKELRAFAGDEAGTRLPDNHGPWTVTGVVAAEAKPPGGNPSQPGRFEPRVRKRRPKEYPVMKKPRRELRKQLAEKDVAA